MGQVCGMNAFLITEMRDIAEQNWELKRIYAKVNL
jgi:hypothetical protein